MPHLPLCHQLLDQLDDTDCTFKHAQLSKYLQNLSAESLLRPTGDEECDGSKISLISSFSTFSSNNSDGITDIEDMYIEAVQA